MFGTEWSLAIGWLSAMYSISYLIQNPVSNNRCRISSHISNFWIEVASARQNAKNVLKTRSNNPHYKNIMCYKIVFGLINVDFCAFFRLAPYCNTRGHGDKLFAEQCTHNVRYHSFARRVVGPWNKLPAHVDFSSLVRFKAFLNRTDLSNFLLYCVD